MQASQSDLLDLKYNLLLQLFDDSNPVNVHGERFIFSTEGHLFPVSKRTKNDPYGWDDSVNHTDMDSVSIRENGMELLRRLAREATTDEEVIVSPYLRKSNETCSTPIGRFELPIERDAMAAVFEGLGIEKNSWL